MKEAYQALKSCWRGMIDNAIKDKASWQKEANMCQQFFDGPYKFMYGNTADGNTSGAYLYSGRSRVVEPTFSVTINKAFELVTLFGPSLYSRNPVCKTNPRKPPEIPPQFFGDPNDPAIQQAIAPMMQQMDQQRVVDTMRSVLLGGLLNYLPEAIDMKDNSQQSIDEAIIKGGGVLWSVMRKFGTFKVPTLEYDTVDHLLLDPDQETQKEAMWCARRFCKPVWEIEVEKGLPHDTLKGSHQSSGMSNAEESIPANQKRKVGKTNDLLVYWGIWSKMGMGGLLRGISSEAAEVDRYGQYVYVEVCDNCPYFLNVPEDIWDNDEEIRRRVQWETPFWDDAPTSNGWPFEMFKYHRSPRKQWPVPHLKPVIGQLMFINWAYSFLMTKVQKTSRDFIAVVKAAAEELKTQIAEGSDLTVLEVEGAFGTQINQVVSFLQHPEMNKDILTVIKAVEESFDKGSGLNELMYGSQPTQDRSAAESNNKANFVNIRPDDMKQKTEETLTNCFRKLAMMSRWHMSGEDVAKIFGPTIGQLWDVHVATADVDELLHCIEYRIEAGSAAKPNKAKDQDDATKAMQAIFPLLSQYATATGNVDQVNALIMFWAKAYDLEAQPFLLVKPEPPPPPTPEPPKFALSLKGEDIMALGLAEQVRAEFGAQGPAPPTANPQGQEMQQEAQQHTMDLAHKELGHRQDLKHATEKQKLDMEILKKKKSMMTNGKKE